MQRSPLRGKGEKRGGSSTLRQAQGERRGMGSRFRGSKSYAKVSIKGEEVYQPLLKGYPKVSTWERGLFLSEAFEGGDDFAQGCDGGVGLVVGGGLVSVGFVVGVGGAGYPDGAEAGL